MTVNLDNIDEMDDDALEAALNGAGGGDTEPEADEQQQEQPDTEQADQPGEPAAQDGEQQAQELEQAAEKVSDAPRQVPLPELLREREKRQEAERRLAEFERRDQEARTRELQQRQAATNQEEYERLLTDEGPEAAWEFAQRVAQAERVAATQEASQRQAIDRIELSETYARRTYGEAEYQAQLNKLVAKFGPEMVLARAAQEADAGEWVYRTGKAIETPEERQAAIAAEVQKQVQEVLKKQQSPNQSLKPGVGGLSSGTGQTVAYRDPDDMTDEELDEAIAARRRS